MSVIALFYSIFDYNGPYNPKGWPTLGLSKDEEVIEENLGEGFSGTGSESDDENEFEFVEEEGVPPFKRFGSLCYTMLQPKKETKVSGAWSKGIFLGFDPQSSNYLVGIFKEGNFSEIRTRNVKFIEHILVANLDELKEGSNNLEKKLEIPGNVTEFSSEEGIIRRSSCVFKRTLVLFPSWTVG